MDTTCSLGAAKTAHAHVQQHEIGIDLGGHRYCGFARVGDADELEAVGGRDDGDDGL
jgi:hypothetical protein